MTGRCVPPAWLLLLIVSFVSAAPAAAQVQLTHKYPQGASFTTEAINNVAQTLTIAGMDIESSAESIITTKSTIGEKDADGLIPIKASVESMQINMKVQGSQYAFDSANPDNAGTSQLEILRGIHKELVGKETTLMIGQDGRVAEIKTPEIALDSVPENVQQIAKGQLDPEYLKQQANQALDQIPSMQIKMGDTWQLNESVDFGGSQLMTFKKRFTYDGLVDGGDKKLHKITSEVLEVDFSIGANSPLPVKLKESKLKIDASSGELLFDEDQGRIVKSKSSVQITGDLIFDLNGTELPAKLDLTMSGDATVR